MPPLLSPPTIPQLLIPILLLLSLEISTTMDLSEKETLFSIMESISSDKDWRSISPEPCNPSSSWPGMECKPGSDNLFHVTKLVFGIPPNPTCVNSATFPSQIFNLPSLQSIHFLNCFKTKKTTLFFPNSHSSSLQQLSLRSNAALTGLIPPQISSLKSLQVLTLSQNHLYGKIPDSIATLSSLIHLDLSYNSLTGRIPAEIWKLNNLVDLDLSYNSLTGPIPPSIGEMVNLQNLDLSSNSLTGTIPQTAEKLKMLTFLALSDNNLSGYPKGLANLQNLQYLIMEGNPMFIPLPPELGKLPRLQELRLGSSGYSGTIPKAICSLTNLTTLSLENNNLSGEIPPGFNGLRKIYHLNLSRNMLEGLVPFSSEFLKRLGRNLDLSGNAGLCVNESGGLKGIIGGVRVCGRGKSSSDGSSDMRQPLESSAVAYLALEVWLWRSWLGFLGFSAVNYFHWSF